MAIVKLAEVCEKIGSGATRAEVKRRTVMKASH